MKKAITVLSIVVSGIMVMPAAVDAKDGWENGKGTENGKALGLAYQQQMDLYYERLAVGRALIEVQAFNWPQIIPYYTDDVEYHDPIVDIYGIDDMAEFLARLFTSSANLVTIVEDEICVDGIYMASWTMSGNFDTVPYTAKGMSTIKFVEGEARVYYQRDYYTEGDIMVSIPGLDEAIYGFRYYYRAQVDPSFEGTPPATE